MRTSTAPDRRHGMRGLTASSLIAVLLLGGCADLGDPVETVDPEPPITVSFADDVQPIFDLHCTGCHGAGGFAGLDLRAESSFASLVNVTATEIDLPRVDPGDPTNSWLYRKLTGTQTVGDPMPLGAFPLPAATVAVVQQWILEGALDN